MSKARLVLTALLVDRQPPAEVAARYGVHRSWVYKLKARYQADGQAAFEPRSRRPHTSPTATPPATVALIVQLREKLGRATAHRRPGRLGQPRHPADPAIAQRPGRRAQQQPLLPLGQVWRDQREGRRQHLIRVHTRTLLQPLTPGKVTKRGPLSSFPISSARHQG
jgi:hypothetical protein